VSQEKHREMRLINPRPKTLIDRPSHFCPGCHHGIIHRLTAEAIDYFNVREKAIGVASVGCSVFLYDFMATDVLEAPHGRASAAATGMKRVQPDKIIYTYQGDGDLAAIGTSEIIHTANRGEPITVVFVNNTNYGMTGGQMAPTTLLGQKTTTTPYGRDFKRDGYPIRMTELLATLEGVAFCARGAVNTPANVKKTRALIRRAFEVQIKDIGFGFVEVLSACPTDWGLKPIDAVKRVEEELIPYYPLGIYKDKKEADHF